MIDLGTGNNNKVNWAMTDKQEFIDIVEVVYRGARKGRGLVVRVQLHDRMCNTWSCSIPHVEQQLPPRQLLMGAFCRLQVSPKDYSTKYRY